MAKKHFRRLLTLAAVVGAAAAGVSYFLQYKSFHKELNEDFHDFEDDFDDFDDTEDKEDKETTRSYVTLTPEHKSEEAGENEPEEIPEAEGEETAAEEKESVEDTKTGSQTEAVPTEAAAQETTVTVEEMTE